MKILIVGQKKGWAIEHHYRRYLATYAEVDIYAADEVFDEFYFKSKLNKIKFKMGFSNVQQKIGQELLAKAKIFQPDIIWVFKGMRLLPEILLELKNKGFLLVNFNPDHPFIFSSKGSGNKNVTDSIGLFDLHFCYSYSVSERIEKEYGIKTIMLPFGYELPESEFQKIENTPEINKACFIGNPDPIRADYLKAMAEAGIELDVYGHDWKSHLSPANKLRIFDATYKGEFWKNMRAYRLQINIFRPHNEGSHNMRTFEIPAVGGIMLAPDSREHREFFEEKKEALFYKNKKELLTTASYILNLSTKETKAIRENARLRSVRSGYNYSNRAKQAVAALAELLKEKKTTDSLVQIQW